jgi:hypothetical protein
MKYLSIFAILFGFLLISSPAFGYTASKFVSDYGEDISKGQKIKVLVNVRGEPESENPTKRAKEIRQLQSAVLKFCNFAGATNVKSDTWNNEFTAMVTTSLAQILEERSDVISVKVIESSSVPDWIQNILEWYKQGLISYQEYQNSIEYLVEMGIITEDAFKKEIQLLLAEKNMQLKDHQSKLLLAQQTNLYVSSTNFYESKYNDEFSGVLCKKQNNIVTLSGNYSNNGIYYYTVFFKLILFDEFGNVVASGLSKIVDVTPKDFRNFSVSTPYKGNIDQCLVLVDSKFIPN